MKTCILLQSTWNFYLFSFRCTCDYPVKEPLLGNRRKIDFIIGTKCGNSYALYIIFIVLFLTSKISDVRTSLLGIHY